MTALFISGPISNDPPSNIVRFRDAESELVDAGYRAVNPARRGDIPEVTWSEWMRLSIKDLLKCDAVAVLDGWQESKGARLEVTIAMDLEMPVHGVYWWLENGEE